MSIEQGDHEVIAGAQRSVQQLVLTAAQIVEIIARTRAVAEHRREADARQTAAAEQAWAAQGAEDRGARAAQDRARAEQGAARRDGRQQWTPANNPAWQRDATPKELLTAWAAATTWSVHRARRRRDALRQG